VRRVSRLTGGRRRARAPRLPKGNSSRWSTSTRGALRRSAKVRHSCFTVSRNCKSTPLLSLTLLTPFDGHGDDGGRGDFLPPRAEVICGGENVVRPRKMSSIFTQAAVYRSIRANVRRISTKKAQWWEILLIGEGLFFSCHSVSQSITRRAEQLVGRLRKRSSDSFCGGKFKLHLRLSRSGNALKLESVDSPRFLRTDTLSSAECLPSPLLY